MPILKLNQKVTYNGIFIPFDKLKDFKDKNVEIIILTSESEPEQSIDYSINLSQTANILREHGQGYQVPGAIEKAEPYYILRTRTVRHYTQTAVESSITGDRFCRIP